MIGDDDLYQPTLRKYVGAHEVGHVIMNMGHLVFRGGSNLMADVPSQLGLDLVPMQCSDAVMTVCKCCAIIRAVERTENNGFKKWRILCPFNKIKSLTQLLTNLICMLKKS